MKINLQSAVTIFMGQFFLCFLVVHNDSVNELQVQRSQKNNYPSLPLPMFRDIIQRMPELANLRPDFILTKHSPEGVRLITNIGDDVKQIKPHVIWERYSRSPSKMSNKKAGKINFSKNPWYQVQVHYVESGNSNYRTWKYHPTELMIPTIKAMQWSKNEESTEMGRSITGKNYAKNPSELNRGNYKYPSGKSLHMKQRPTFYDFL